MIRTAIQLFLAILGAALLSSLLGGAFGWLVAAISPEFAVSLFCLPVRNIPGYAFAVGMVWGLFLGAAVGGLACSLTVILKAVALWVDATKRHAPESTTPSL